MKCRDEIRSRRRTCIRTARWRVDGWAVCGVHRNKRLRAPGEHFVEEFKA